MLQRFSLREHPSDAPGAPEKSSGHKECPGEPGWEWRDPHGLWGVLGILQDERFINNWWLILA